MNIDFKGDYKAKLNEIIDGLYENKSGMSRNQRIWAVQYYTDEYVRQTGERPESGALDRLATLILDDEIADKDRMKMRNNEYPIMSDDQQERRDREVASIKWAEEVGVDGKDHRPKTSKTVRSRERRFMSYREFTKVQPVITYNLREI
ncbi:hypothetical protein SAMN05216389_1118 [Oceanobacillus limi]|uniref:Uncharacterized protein n=1 Tax=Oceanobacillus limi TaxID=930131 RepID=A0A1I0EAA6_9BACI|nr:hypothetical protein [Oceanobacillus limi]SET42133.1 hypothetical protein SAMN05216389_1118 [Oceanobacillus limi]